MKANYIALAIVTIIAFSLKNIYGEEGVPGSPVKLQCRTEDGEGISRANWRGSDGIMVAQEQVGVNGLNAFNYVPGPYKDMYEVTVSGDTSTFTVKKAGPQSLCFTCVLLTASGKEETYQRCIEIKTEGITYVLEKHENETKITCFVGSKHGNPRWRVTGIVTGGVMSYERPQGFTQNVADYRYTSIKVNESVIGHVETPYCRYWLNDTHAREFPVRYVGKESGKEYLVTEYKDVYGRW
nr:CPPV036 Ig-like domain protein [Cooks petrelpox virus]